MAARIKTDTLQLGIADLAKLEGGVHVDIDVMLLLGHFDVLLWRDVDVLADVGVVRLPVWIEIPKIALARGKRAIKT
jgi:hypothetical protein